MHAHSHAERHAGTDRHTVRSYPERARYDREFVDRVLDDGRIGHLATTLDGYPHIVPMMFVRRGDHLHIHGRRGTPLMDHLAAGGDLAFAVTLVDGVVLARSVRYHSVNYRSVVVHGQATPVTESAERSASFIALAEKSWPGRTGISPPTAGQLSVIELLSVPIEMFAAKTRTGPPMDPDPTPDSSVWAGHIDLQTIAGSAHPDSHTAAGIAAPTWPTSPTTRFAEGN